MTAVLVRDGRADGWVVSPVMGDRCVLLTLFPETDVMCTTIPVIQQSVDACGGGGWKWVQRAGSG